eukprot:13379293-Alexandrium_andersonii.AAC.1
MSEASPHLPVHNSAKQRRICRIKSCTDRAVDRPHHLHERTWSARTHPHPARQATPRHGQPRAKRDNGTQ